MCLGRLRGKGKVVVRSTEFGWDSVGWMASRLVGVGVWTGDDGAGQLPWCHPGGRNSQYETWGRSARQDEVL